MATRTTRTEVLGAAWIGTEDEDEYWAEGTAGRLEVELTDQDEVRLGIRVADNLSRDNVTFYLSRAEAARLALMIGKASLDELPT